MPDPHAIAAPPPLPSLSRRGSLGALLGGALGGLLPWPPGQAHARAPALWRVAAWEDEAATQRVGLLQRGPLGWQVLDSTVVPTRAHGLQVLPDGMVLAVARRPGDWLLQWRPLAKSPDTGRLHWALAQRQFNGHALLHPNGRHLLVTETDTEADDGLGRGLVTLRELASLEVLAEWPTHGRDPHQALASPDGRWLWVANGGIASRRDTGRARLAGQPMNASLAAIDLADGSLHQRWQLADPRLSLRHLAWHAPSATLGLALQAEHTEPGQRQTAPVLALLRPGDAGAQLRVADAGEGMAGYGGDVCAGAQGFAVSSPRGSQVGFWSTEGRWLGGVALTQACALATDDGAAISAAGVGLVLDRLEPGSSPGLASHPSASPKQLDNHWVAWSTPLTPAPAQPAPHRWPTGGRNPERGGSESTQQATTPA